MILSEHQFISPKEFFEVIDGKERYALSLLAENCGYGPYWESIDIVEKAILLLKHGADISRPNFDGCTVLHTILGCDRRHEFSSARRGCGSRQRIRSLHEPREFLIASIAAGANVHAIDANGLTPSMYARMCHREMEWIKALRSTGYDPQEVIAHSDPDSHDCPCRHQASRLSFEEYCLQRETGLEFRNSDISDGEGEDGSDNDDGSEDSSEDEEDSEEFVEDDGEEVTDNENGDDEYENYLSPNNKEHENANTDLLDQHKYAGNVT
jgi:hypothetical protein